MCRDLHWMHALEMRGMGRAVEGVLSVGSSIAKQTLMRYAL